MGKPRIILAGLGSMLEGLRWESDRVLRIGRSDNLDIVLADTTVSRLHAEVQNVGNRWVVRDLAENDRHPTFVNGERLGTKERALQPLDVVQVGRLSLRVIGIELDTSAAPSEPAAHANGNGHDNGKMADHINMSGTFVRVQAMTNRSWDQAMESVALGNKPQQGQTTLTLLRASHHLTHISCLDELLQSILSDAMASLGAQRGSIVLLNADTGQLELKAAIGPGLPMDSQACYSKTLANRCFVSSESFLCRDVSLDDALNQARSVRHGTMASIISALLRSSRKKIGILQLDRGPFQEPFAEADLYLADALAASVAAGIETAQLVETQRDQFIQTVTSLARAVEMRDQYTGDHTRRVTQFSLYLAEELKLSPMAKYQIQIGTPLHDIGKIGIDDCILRKPGKLTHSEFEFMKTHTIKGASILESIFNLNPMIPIVRHHHEKWDGSGYPDGLAKDKIPQIARLVAVADAFDAMTSQRPYRPAMSVDQAYLELMKKAGSHFDPTCIDAFLRMRRKVENFISEHGD